MLGEQKTVITSLADILTKNMYNVNTSWDNCSVNLSAQTLLDIAAYVLVHHAKLEQQVQENVENLHVQLADTVEMCQINPEWRYRTSDLRLSSPPTESKSVDEGAEDNQHDQSQDKEDTSQINPEWRYRTSDLRL